jgi:hypothetical protein
LSKFLTGSGRDVMYHYNKRMLASGASGSICKFVILVTQEAEISRVAV